MWGQRLIFVVWDIREAFPYDPLWGWQRKKISLPDCITRSVLARRNGHLPPESKRLL